MAASWTPKIAETDIVFRPFVEVANELSGLLLLSGYSYSAASFRCIIVYFALLGYIGLAFNGPS